jgi:hypothetical protein
MEPLPTEAAKAAGAASFSVKIPTMRDTDADILSLEPPIPDQDRRQFLVTKLATGFALAVQPVTAQTITTSTEGLEAGEIKIPVPDGEIPGYRAMPAKGNRFPVALVVCQGRLLRRCSRVVCAPGRCR